MKALEPEQGGNLRLGAWGARSAARRRLAQRRRRRSHARARTANSTWRESRERPQQGELGAVQLPEDRHDRKRFAEPPR